MLDISSTYTTSHDKKKEDSHSDMDIGIMGKDTILWAKLRHTTLQSLRQHVTDEQA